MKSKLSYLALTAMLLSASFALCAEDRPMVSEGERAFAALQVQNTQSKHAYYHAAGMNLEEVDALWVSADGEFADTATFASPQWVMSGLQTIRGAYGLENQSRREAALRQLSEMFPDVEFTEVNLGAGHEWAMHTNTTPIIEVAGDGQTAKGMWYSPGMGLMAQLRGGDANVGGVFFWEKYAGDFVKENGQWKIWHLQMAYDFTPPLPEIWREPLQIKGASTEQESQEAGSPPGGPGAGNGDGAMKEAGERMAPALPPGFLKPAYSYPLWSPKRPGLIYPRLPEPYYTFSETFSYCNCDESSFPVNSGTVGTVKLSE